MPLLNSCTCTSGLVATAALVLLLLPVQYYVPQLAAPGEPCAAAAGAPGSLPPSRSPPPGWLPLLADLHLNALDLVVSAVLLALTAYIYISEWVQRKLMERRIIKMNHYLGERLELLRAWDAQQEQLEAKLRMVRQATSEYNLLLYLLLERQRRRRLPGGKDADDAFPRPALEA